jgi:uncharacterized protein (TIGR02246 family)
MLGQRGTAQLKKAFTLIVLAAIVAATPAAKAAEPGTPQAIERLDHEFVKAWNAHDPNKMASFWAETGDLINPFGQKAGGRAAVEKLFEDEQAGLMKASTYKIESTSLRELNRGAAIGEWESVITGMTDPDGKPLAPFRHHVTVVYVETGGRWWFEAVRAYTFSPAPGAPMK